MTAKPRLILDTCVLVYALDAQLSPELQDPAHLQAKACLDDAYENGELCFTPWTWREFKLIARDIQGLRGTSFLQLPARERFIKHIEARSTVVDFHPHHPTPSKTHEILRLAADVEAVCLISFAEDMWHRK